MKLLKFLLIISIVALSQSSCIERRGKSGGNLDANLIEQDGPRVVRDTIIQVVILDTITGNNNELDIEAEAARQKAARQQASTTSTQKKPTNYSSNTSNKSRYRDDDDYDPSNAGFFDQYRAGYNSDVVITERIPEKKEAAPAQPDPSINEKKKELERKLQELEQRNQEEMIRRQELELKRQEYNKQVKEELRQGKEKQQRQQQQEKGKKSKPKKGKTLDTNLFIDK